MSDQSMSPAPDRAADGASNSETKNATEAGKRPFYDKKQVSPAEFLSMGPNPPMFEDDRFKDELQDKFVVDWSEDAAFQKLVGLRRDLLQKKRINEAEWLAPVWKLCAGTWGCWPSRIISLEYHLTVKGPLSMIWTRPFCQALFPILASNLGKGHIPTIRAYLQYAVICRTNDNTLWPVQPFTNNAFISDLIAAMKQAPDKAIPELRKQVAEAGIYGPDTLQIPEESLVFEQIEHQLYRATKALTKQQGRVTYRLKRADLIAIVKAFEMLEVRQSGAPILLNSGGRFYSTQPVEARHMLNAVESATKHELALSHWYESQPDKAAEAPPDEQVTQDGHAEDINMGGNTPQIDE